MEIQETARQATHLRVVTGKVSSEFHDVPDLLFIGFSHLITPLPSKGQLTTNQASAPLHGYPFLDHPGRNTR